LVALLQRLARVAVLQALLLRGRERNVLAVGPAAVGPAELGAAQRPAGGGGRRRLDAGHAHAGDLVAVVVHLRYEDRVRGATHKRCRVTRENPAFELRTEIAEVPGGDHPGVHDARDARPAELVLWHHAGLEPRTRHRPRAMTALRDLALRRHDPIAHPCVEREQQRAMRAIGADAVGELLTDASVGDVADAVRLARHQVIPDVFGVLQVFAV